MEFRPYGAGRYELDGPQVALSANETLTLGLLFHELVTNAVKYGALSLPTGRVLIQWRLARRADGQDLMLEWIEQGGPPVRAPSQRGFGSRLIERSLQGEMNGAATLEFRPDGLICRVRAPLKAGG